MEKYKDYNTLNNAIDCYYIGINQLSRGLLKHAFQAFEKGLQINPNQTSCKIGKAVILKILNENESADKIIAKLNESESKEQLDSIFSEVLLSVNKLSTNISNINFQKLKQVNTPHVTLSCMKGQFGNCMIQYIFYKLYLKKYNLYGALQDWVGNKIFKLNDNNNLETFYPLYFETEGPPYLEDLFEMDTPPHIHVDMNGYFQVHTQLLKPYKDYIQSLFILQDEILEWVETIHSKITYGYKNLFVVHLRFGDAAEQGRITRTELYRLWLEKALKEIEKPILYIATDDWQRVEGIFSNFSMPDYAELKKIKPPIDGIDFFDDFYICSKANYLAVSPSTFSYSAALLNKNLIQCYRQNQNGIEAFDIWNSEFCR